MFGKIGSNMKVSSPKERLEGRKLRAVVLEVISTKGSKLFSQNERDSSILSSFVLQVTLLVDVV